MRVFVGGWPRVVAEFAIPTAETFHRPTMANERVRVRVRLPFRPSSLVADKIIVDRASAYIVRSSMATLRQF